MARSKARLFGFAVIAGLGPALVACHLITGLDDYDKVQCPGAICGDSGVDVNNDVPTIDQKNPDVVPIDAQGARPVSWARWKMPNYDGGGATDNLLDYTFDQTTVSDKITGLFWMRTIPQPVQGTKTYEAARAACEGAGEWRLPSRIELVTLLHLGEAPTIDKTAFPSAAGGEHWTSSEVRLPGGALTNPKKYWVVDFSSGELRQREETAQAAIRCVRGK